MSGGPLVRLDAHQQWKIVGILTDWHPNKQVMVAAHIGFCLGLLRTEFPDLAAALPPPKFLLIHSRVTAL
jgi:hypothetical protein